MTAKSKTTQQSKSKHPQHAHTTGRHHIDRHAEAYQRVPEAAGDDDDLLTTKEVAEWLKCSVQFLEIGRAKGYGPKFKPIGPNMVRYRRDGVRQWLRERGEFSNTTQARALRAKDKAERKIKGGRDEQDHA